MFDAEDEALKWIRAAADARPDRVALDPAR